MDKRTATIVGVIAAVLLGAGIFYYLGSNSNDNTADSATNSSTSPPPKETTQPNPPPQDTEATTGGSDTDTQQTSAVTISDMAFSPKQISVKVGTTVTWTNQDEVQHNVKSDDGSSDGPSSELLSKGQSYSFTFKKAGTYAYHCGPHPFMKGTVTVTE